MRWLDCHRGIKLINILYLHAGAEMYGADKVLLELVTGLDKSKFHPIVILPNKGVLTEELKRNGIEVYTVDYPILRRKYFNIKGIIKYINSYKGAINEILNIVTEKRIDMIHVNTVAVLEGVVLKRKLHAPLLWHVHEILERPKPVVTFLNMMLGKFATKIIAVSNSVAKNLSKSKFIKSEQIQIIYNGVDNKVFNSDTEIDYLFNELDIPKDSIKVGMVGRVNSWKGQHDFLEAAAPLLEENKKLYVVMVGGVFLGEEWRFTELEQQVKEKNNNERIKVIGLRQDTANLHNFFDVFVLPSTQPDPLPTVVLESMATGKPIVGYAHGGITEMVKDSENGFLVTPKDIKELRNAIEKLVIDEDLRNHFGKVSLKREETLFSLTSYIDNFSQVYLNLDRNKR